MKRNLFARANEYVSQLSRPFLIISGLLLVLFVGVADYITGAELSISIFYLFPISLMTWFVNGKIGVYFSVVSFTVELATDLVVGHPYSHPITVYWNNSVQLGFFLIIVFILSALKIEYKKTVKLNTNLQRTLIELKRTQDASERKARDLARSNEELEEFAYVAAHDLKEPLIVVGGYINRLQRLYKDKPGPNADKFIRYTLDAIARMEALIDGLLAYAKVGTKRKNFKLTDFNDIVERATINLRAEIEKIGAIVTHSQLPTLLTHDIQIIQLFQNLIGNSIKFRKEESPRIHVSAEQNEKEWIFSVIDNGIGIDPKHLNCIFDVFQRLHSSSEYPQAMASV